MRVHLYEDELWPYYGMSTSNDWSRAWEVDKVTLRRWRRQLRAFRKMQDEMAAVMRSAPVSPSA